MDNFDNLVPVNPKEEPVEEYHQTGNPYFDAVSGRVPPELLSMERAMYPYANDLPGVSNVNAARTLGNALRLGLHGNRLTSVVSTVLVLLLGIGVLITLFNYVGH